MGTWQPGMARQSVSDVPQSRHSLFMRGFTGNIEMGRIRDFFAREGGGKCSFDFFKQSADGSRLFVAIRFGSRSTAQEVRDRFHGQEVLGCKLQISWFKDIRRYAAHTGTMINFNNNDRRPPMNGRFDPNYRRPPNWTGPQDRYYRPHSNGRPPQRDSRRSRSSGSSSSSSSRSPADRRRNSHGPSEGSAGRKSADSRRNSSRDSRSNSPRSPRRRSESPEAPPPPIVPPPPTQLPSTNWEIPLPPGSPKTAEGAEMVVVDQADGDSSPPRGRLDAAKYRLATIRCRDALLPPIEPQISTQLSAAPPSGNSVVLGAKFRPIDRPADDVDNSNRRRRDQVDSNASDEEPLGAGDDLFAADLITSPATGDLDDLPDRREHRKNKRKRHRREKSVERPIIQPLSRIAQGVAEQMDRKLKISGLSGAKLESLKEKKLSLETGYKSDCDTFLLVVKLLISKDTSLEDKILAALRESLKEIGQKYLAELNELVDQLLLQPD